MRADTRLENTLVCPIKSDVRQVIFPFLGLIAEHDCVAAAGKIRVNLVSRLAPVACAAEMQGQHGEQQAHRRRGKARIIPHQQRARICRAKKFTAQPRR